MSCPICAKPTDQTYRPFCSRRCADVDLARWLNGSYAVPAEEDEDWSKDPDKDVGKPH
ncbi:DNA gyrase inhibitor YacG [Palleronia pelagia]|uniref:DNA gyrase inhibitor YacG n=1 Tax=Palleronia pelagia TaxID=387096 RepID=A0A1H8HC04_9RHOB|nr:DNA gyrase inhibitor YacG [Palleronia pelagia]SEN53732.1 hypothetical protein SAMN04488011_104384 [Palleronia pelagia]